MNSLHPYVIHFPIVLALAWPVLDAVGFFTGQAQYKRVAVVALVLAVLVSIAATVTGQAAFDVAVEKAVDPELLRSHSDDADLVPWALLGLLAARAWLPLKFGRKGHALVLALGVMTTLLVLSVGRAGGRLVYEHGVGVFAPCASR